MDEYGAMFQIEDSFWYRGGKIYFQNDKLVLTFFGSVKDEIYYTDIIRIQKGYYLYMHQITIICKNKSIYLIPGLFSYKKISDELSLRSLKKR